MERECYKCNGEGGWYYDPDGPRDASGNITCEVCDGSGQVETECQCPETYQRDDKEFKHTSERCFGCDEIHCENCTYSVGTKKYCAPYYVLVLLEQISERDQLNGSLALENNRLLDHIRVLKANKERTHVKI